MRFIEALIISIITFLVFGVVGWLISLLKTGITAVLAGAVGTKLTLFIVNRLTFIGTIHHELAHALLALITGAKVTRVRLLEFGGSNLGSIEYIARGNIITKSIQHTFTAYAPVICGFITEYLMLTKININSNILKYYIMFSILIHMTMSTQDIKMCLRGLPICILILAVILSIFNIRITDIKSLIVV